MYQNNGIVAYGLGGSAVSYILGAFSLGTKKIEVIITPNRGNGGGSYPSYYPNRLRDNKKPIYDLVTIKVKHRGKTWKHEYSVLREVQPLIIKIVSVINTISTNISFSFDKLRKIKNKFRIK